DVVGVFGGAGQLRMPLVLEAALADDREICLAHPAFRSRAPVRSSPAASSTASKILVYPVHRHRLPASASRISSRFGFALRASKAVPLISIPGVQYPHWAPPVRAKAR